MVYSAVSVNQVSHVWPWSRILIFASHPRTKVSKLLSWQSSGTSQL